MPLLKSLKNLQVLAPEEDKTEAAAPTDESTATQEDPHDNENEDT